MYMYIENHKKIDDLVIEENYSGVCLLQLWNCFVFLFVCSV